MYLRTRSGWGLEPQLGRPLIWASMAWIMENNVRVLILQVAAHRKALQGPNEKGYQVLLLPGTALAVACCEEKGGQRYKWLKRKQK